LLLGIPVTVGACGLEVSPERFEGVDFTASHITDRELRDTSYLMLLIQNEYDLPVVEAEITYPRGASTGGTPLRADDSWYGTAHDYFEDPPRVGVKGGAIPPGEGGTVFIRIGMLGAREGDTLAFPVELTLEDGSIVEWTDPPGSEKPAPMVEVGEPPTRNPAVFLLVLTALALVVLLTAGGYMLRQHSGRSR
jgi:hypothetical protein